MGETSWDLYATLEDVEARNLDGTDNNETHHEWGAVDTPFARITTNSYTDGLGAMALPIAPRTEPVGNNPVTPNTGLIGDLPRPRDLTDAVMAQDPNDNITNSFGVNEYLQFFGQFLTHDMTESATGPTADPPGPPLFLDGLPFPFARTPFELDGSGVRQQLNEETSFLDMSQIYGNSDASLDLLRANNPDGTQSPYLLLGADDLLPTFAEVAADSGVPLGAQGTPNTVLGTLIPDGFPGFPADPNVAGALFASGDNRVNQQVPLMSQHTTWAREHNYWVDQLKALYPDWTDQELFDGAKAMVEAEWQSVVYNEYLPALLGPNALSDYTGYDPTVDPSIINEFTTAAFRLGHDQSTNLLLLLLENGQDGASGPQTLAQAFADIGTIDSAADLDEWIRGQLSQYTQEIDGKVVDGNRNLLFNIGSPAGPATVDLEVFDIQRGRDHGLNGYNHMRADLGLGAYASFDAFGSDNNVDANTLNALKLLYGDDISKLDTIIGGLLETKVPGSQLGETFHMLTVLQFEALRDGDRFYYENRFADNPELLAKIEGTSLTDIIARTSPGIEHLYHDGFAAHNRIGGDDGSNRINGDPDGAEGVNDLILGFDGRDFLKGLDGNDDIYAGEGRDKAWGGDGNDWIFGEAGHDRLWGGWGDDLVKAGSGNDRLHGGGDNDWLYGEAGRDKLWGDDGNDLISGGTGNDKLRGGDGWDIFVFEEGTDHDRVFDFNVWEDKIDFSAFNFWSYEDVLEVAEQRGNKTIIDLGDGDQVKILGVKLYELSPDNFILADDDHDPYQV